MIRLRYMVKVPYHRRTALSRRAVFARDDHRCQYCGGTPTRSTTSCRGRAAAQHDVGERRRGLPAVQPAQARPHARRGRHAPGPPVPRAPRELAWVRSSVGARARGVEAVPRHAPAELAVAWPRRARRQRRRRGADVPRAARIGRRVDAGGVVVRRRPRRRSCSARRSATTASTSARAAAPASRSCAGAAAGERCCSCPARCVWVDVVVPPATRCGTTTSARSMYVARRGVGAALAVARRRRRDGAPRRAACARRGRPRCASPASGRARCSRDGAQARRHQPAAHPRRRPVPVRVSTCAGAPRLRRRCSSPTPRPTPPDDLAADGRRRRPPTVAPPSTPPSPTPLSRPDRAGSRPAAAAEPAARAAHRVALRGARREQLRDRAAVRRARAAVGADGARDGEWGRNGGEWLTWGELGGRWGSRGGGHADSASDRQAGRPGSEGRDVAGTVLFVGRTSASSTTRVGWHSPSAFRPTSASSCYLVVRAATGASRCSPPRTFEAEAERLHEQVQRGEIGRDAQRASLASAIAGHRRQAGPHQHRRAAARLRRARAATRRASSPATSTGSRSGSPAASGGSSEAGDDEHGRRRRLTAMPRQRTTNTNDTKEDTRQHHDRHARPLNQHVRSSAVFRPHKMDSPYSARFRLARPGRHPGGNRRPGDCRSERRQHDERSSDDERPVTVRRRASTTCR